MIHGELADVNASVVVIDPIRKLVYFGYPGTQAETETGDELILGMAEYGPEGVVVNDWDNPALWGMGDDLLGAIAAGSLFEFPDGVDLGKCHIFPTDDPPADCRDLAEMPEVAGWIATAEGCGVPSPPTRDDLDAPRIVVTPAGEGSCLPDLMAHVGYSDVREMDPDATEDEIRCLEMAARTFRPADTASMDAVLCVACAGHRWHGDYAPVVVRARALASALVALRDAKPCFARYFESPDGQVAPFSWSGFRVRDNHMCGRCGLMSVEDAAMARGACGEHDVVRACIEASTDAMAEVSREAEAITDQTLSWYDTTVEGGDVLGSVENGIVNGEPFRVSIDHAYISRDIAEAVALIERTVAEKGCLPAAGDLPYQVEDALCELGLDARDGHLTPADLEAAGLAEAVDVAWPWEDAYVEYTCANPPSEVQEALRREVVARVSMASKTEALERAVEAVVGWRDPTCAPDPILAPRGWRKTPAPAQVADAAMRAAGVSGGTKERKPAHGQGL